MHQPDMKKLTVSEFRSQLNRLFTLARRLAKTPEDLQALNEREREAAQRHGLNELLRREFGEDEWTRRG
jgi:hypothetical protein